MVFIPHVRESFNLFPPLGYIIKIGHGDGRRVGRESAEMCYGAGGDENGDKHDGHDDEDGCDDDGRDGDDSDDDDECGVMMMTTMACTLACVDMGHIYEHGQEQWQWHGPEHGHGSTSRAWGMCMSMDMGMSMGNGNDNDMGIYEHGHGQMYVHGHDMDMGAWTRARATMIIDKGMRAGPRASERVYGNNTDRVSSRV